MNANTNTYRTSQSACANSDLLCEEEASMLSRLQAGESSAFEQLVYQEGGRMLATARRFFHSEQDAADAVQDAFIAAFKAIKTFKGDSRLGTWLHRVVVNASLMRRRSRDRHPTVDIESLLPQFDSTGHHVHPVKRFHKTPYDALEIDETRKQVRQNIGRLPEAYREVLMLRDIEEFDTETTASMLDVSVAVVKTRLHRARQALRQLLEQVFEEG